MIHKTLIVQARVDIEVSEAGVKDDELERAIDLVAISGTSLLSVKNCELLKINYVTKGVLTNDEINSLLYDSFFNNKFRGGTNEGSE